MIERIKDIVREASKLMVADGFEINQKEGYANIVTSSDVAVQDFLKEHLAELLPGSGFLCEEEDMHDLTNEYTWIIDPIDGPPWTMALRTSAAYANVRYVLD